MNDSAYSFVYDRQSADLTFHGIAPRELTLSILAGIQPLAQWEGCTVYRGPSPLEGGTVCIGTSGPGADEVQLRLIEGFEHQAVRVLEVYEGGPEAVEEIATVRAGRWSAP
jgi:hypothetical protein